MPPRERTNMTYYNVFMDKFTRRLPDNSEGENIVERTNKEGHKVWEKHYIALDDIVLAKIEEQDHPEFGKSYDITFIDGNEYAKVRLPNGRIGSDFLLRLENIELDVPFSMQLFMNKETEKVSLGINQKGEWLSQVYTKANPGKLPPPKQVTYNGKQSWDWTDQLNYWSNLIKEINQHLPGVHDGMASAAHDQSNPPPDDWKPEDNKRTSGTVSYDPKKDNEPPMAPGDETDDLPF